MASKFGDNTAKNLGRVTLNPFPHMDLIGTVVLPVVSFFWGGFLIGWGIPVPVDYRNLKNRKRDSLMIALAGPVSNLILAFLLAGLIHLFHFYFPQWFNPDSSFNGYTIMAAVMQVFFLNLALTFFNLIPIHPLDGGKVLYGLLPEPWAHRFNNFAGRYGFMLLLILLMSGAFQVFVGYPVKKMAEWLL